MQGSLVRVDVDSSCVGGFWSESARKLSILSICLLGVRGMTVRVSVLRIRRIAEAGRRKGKRGRERERESASVCAPCRGETTLWALVFTRDSIHARIYRWTPYPSFRTDRSDDRQNSLLRSLDHPNLATSPKNGTFRTHARTESPTFTQAAPFSPRLTPSSTTWLRRGN